MAGVKMAKTNNLTFCPRQGRVFLIAGVYGKLPRTGHGILCAGQVQV
jgi:hypothetical protein